MHSIEMKEGHSTTNPWYEYQNNSSKPKHNKQEKKREHWGDWEDEGEDRKKLLSNADEIRSRYKIYVCIYVFMYMNKCKRKSNKRLCVKS